jgi:hypothetical protein
MFGRKREKKLGLYLREQQRVIAEVARTRQPINFGKVAYFPPSSDGIPVCGPRVDGRGFKEWPAPKID